MIGGKIEPGETAWETAVRELGEETGLTPHHLWAIPSANVFYEWADDRVNIAPAFAAELPADPTLDDEHVGFEWLSVDDAVERLVYPEQIRLIRLIASILDGPGVPANWSVPHDQVRGGPDAERTRARISTDGFA